MDLNSQGSIPEMKSSCAVRGILFRPFREGGAGEDQEQVIRLKRLAKHDENRDVAQRCARRCRGARAAALPRRLELRGPWVALSEERRWPERVVLHDRRPPAVQGKLPCRRGPSARPVDGVVVIAGDGRRSPALAGGQAPSSATISGAYVAQHLNSLLLCCVVSCAVGLGTEGCCCCMLLAPGPSWCARCRAARRTGARDTRRPWLVSCCWFFVLFNPSP